MMQWVSLDYMFVFLFLFICFCHKSCTNLQEPKGLIQRADAGLCICYLSGFFLRSVVKIL